MFSYPCPTLKPVNSASLGLEPASQAILMCSYQNHCFTGRCDGLTMEEMSEISVDRDANNNFEIGDVDAFTFMFLD